MKREYEITLAGCTYPIQFRFIETSSFFKNLKPSLSSEQYLTVTDSDYAYWRSMGNEVDANAEYSLFSTRLSDRLLEEEKCVFHSVAFICKNRAWLLCGDPGVGKSTQYRNLKEFYGDDIEIISGDRPILEVKENSIIVHPSPWNGKEKWAGERAAQLGGIFFLTQGKDNSMSEDISLQTAILRVYGSIFQSFENIDVISNAGKMCEQIILKTRFAELINTGSLDSSKLIYETITKEIG